MKQSLSAVRQATIKQFINVTMKQFNNTIMNKSNIKKIIFGISLLFIGSNAYSQDFVYDWVRSAGGERWDLANDIVIDNEKYIYMTGGCAHFIKILEYSVPILG